MTGYSLYLDAAGHPADQPHVVVAGFMATRTAWVKFGHEWKKALLRNGLNPVFHMTDFEKKYKDSNRHDEILKDLIVVISNHTSAAIACSVSMDGYRNVNSHYILEEAIGKPYAIAARGAYRNAAAWQKAYGRPGKIITFVESGTLHEGDMRQCFVRDDLDEPVPVKKEHPSAQAADLLAWEVATHQKTAFIRPTLALIANLFPYPFRHNPGVLNRRRLRENAELVGLMRRKDVPPETTIVFHSLPKNPRHRKIK
jgi:hypothetical protein